MDNTNRRVKRGWMNLKVTKVIDETHDTKTFVMEDLEEGGRTWDYWAGQYLTFRFDDVDSKPVVRSYTLSSSPCQERLCAFTVKRIEHGKVSNYLCDRVNVGDVLRARGPIGRFIYEPEKDHKHLVMIAAGSGVTPFVSILRQHAGTLGERGSPETMTLLVSYRSRQDLILFDELQKLSKLPKINVHITLSRDVEAPNEFWQGRITRESIIKCVTETTDLGGFKNCTFMSCGPVPIMNLVSEVARAHGVAEGQIKVESFES